MRVVHVCRVAPPDLGGMESVVDGLSEAQLRAGHDVSIVTIAEGTARTTASGVPIVRLTRVGPRRWSGAMGLSAHLSGVDLVHVHGVDGLADQVLTQRPAGVAVGVSTHGGFWHTQRQATLKAVWLRTLTRLSLGRASAVWFTSAADAAAFGPARLRGEVVGNGLQLGRLLAQERRPEPGLWVAPGRIASHKGLVALLDVVAAARRLDPSVRLWILGRPEDAGIVEALRARAAALGIAAHLEVEGPVSEEQLHEALASCTLALFPSRHEGFGLTVVEAMAAGVAPVVRPIPAHTELVTDGVHGHHESFDDGAAARLVAMAHPSHLLGNAARERASTYTWDAVYPSWEAAYARALGVTR